MSYESTIEYYRIINETVNNRLKGLTSAPMLIESYDFSIIEKLQSEGNWEKLSSILVQSAKKLESQGADYIAIATNTMHLIAPQVQEGINIPLIHIVQAVCNQIKEKNIDRVCLLGTKYTLKMPFYREILEKNGIEVIIPNENDIETVNNIIYQELCKGIIKDKSKQSLLAIIDSCASLGAKAAILGCTELPNIIKEASIDIIDTTKAHCLEIVKQIIS